MEYLEGETLADRLTRGPLPLEQVLKYAVEICEGLEKAHRNGAPRLEARQRHADEIGRQADGHAPALKERMDRIQHLARTMPADIPGRDRPSALPV